MDTLDQIIAKALCESFQVVTELKWEPESVAIYTAAVRDALLAEGRIQDVRRFDKPFAPHERALVIPLGCGNAKERHTMSGRIPVKRGPQKWDWSTPDGMIVWLAARLEEVERSVPPGDGQGIVQQILDTELPALREMLKERAS